MTPFALQIDNFSGPIDLLLQMIETKKLPISHVSLAGIADEYILFITQNEEELENKTYFLSIIATLILIKSKSLLPDLSYTEEEERDIASLETRMVLLKLFQRGGGYIEQHFLSPSRIYEPRPRKITPGFNPGGVTRESLALAINDVISNHSVEIKISERKITRVIKLEEVLRRLEDRIRHAMEESFFRFVQGGGEDMSIEEKKKYTAVSFLALLELIRSGMIAVSQNDYYEDIIIKHNT